MTSSLNESTSPLTCDQLEFMLMIIMIMVMLMLELKTITMFPTTNIINSAEPVGDGGPRENSSYRGLTMKIYEVGENRSGISSHKRLYIKGCGVAPSGVGREAGDRRYHRRVMPRK